MFSSNSNGGHYIGKIIICHDSTPVLKVCHFVPTTLLHLWMNQNNIHTVSTYLDMILVSEGIKETRHLRLTSEPWSVFVIISKKPDCDCPELNVNCHQVSNMRRILVGNKIVDHSDVVGASPVAAAPTTSSLST